MAWGFIGALLVMLITAAVLWAAAQLIGLGDFARHRAFLAQYPLELTGFGLLTLGISLFLVGPVQPGHAWTLLVGLKETRWSGWLGAFLLLALVDLGLQIFLPPIAVLTAWPLLAAALIMAVTAFGGGGRFEAIVGLVAMLIIGALGLGHLGHFADQTFSAVGEMAPYLLALFVLLALPMLFPLLAGWGRAGAATQLVSFAIALIGAGTLTYAALHDPASPRLPTYVQAFYLQDSVTGKGWRASSLDKLDPWSAGVLTAGRGKPERREVEALNGKLWLSAAPDASENRPVFTSSRDGDAVVVHIAPQAGGRELRMTLTATSAVKDVTIDAKPVAILGKANAPSYPRWSAPGDGLTLRFTPEAKAGELHLLYAEVKDGWPAGQTPTAKPAKMMAWGLSDTTVITDELKTKW